MSLCVILDRDYAAASSDHHQKALWKVQSLALAQAHHLYLNFVAWHLLLLIIAIYSNKLQRNLRPLATRMDHFPGSWLILGSLIALVSIPPLFGHELLAVIAGYVYGSKHGFIILTVFSIMGETGVYFVIRYKLKNYLDSFRQRHHKNYGVFVAVVEEGGILMLWLIRMSVIPPHFSTPLFSSLDNITWWKWMLANVLASPIKFFPPVFIGTLLRDKRNNSVVGDLAFGVSTIVTLAVLWYIRRQFLFKKEQLRSAKVTEGDIITEGGLQDDSPRREKDLEQGQSDLPEGLPSYDVASSSNEQTTNNSVSLTSTRCTDNDIVVTTHHTRFYEMMEMKKDPMYPATAMIRGGRAS